MSVLRQGRGKNHRRIAGTLRRLEAQHWQTLRLHRAPAGATFEQVPKRLGRGGTADERRRFAAIHRSPPEEEIQ